jgi:hypothetical protein
MPSLPISPPPDAPNTASVEDRMRRALGLTGDRAGRSSPPPPERPQAGPPTRPAGRSSADKPRRRFVPDGAVPVAVLNRHRPDEVDGPSASRAAIEATLQDERTARVKAERSLHEALATVHDLQTKLGHAELAHREASVAAQAARAAADALQAQHQERELRWSQDLAAARTAAEAALAEAAGARGQAARTRRPLPAVEPAFKAQDSVPTPAAKAAAKRTCKVAAELRRREPQPVKWWLRLARNRWP